MIHNHQTLDIKTSQTPGLLSLATNPNIWPDSNKMCFFGTIYLLFPKKYYIYVLYQILTLPLYLDYKFQLKAKG